MTFPQAPQFPQAYVDPSQAYGAPAGYPQQPQVPGYPQQPQAPVGYPQGYPQQPQAPAYPQGYGQQYGAPQGYPQQPEPPQTEPGSLDAFYAQPSVGQGPGLKFQPGQRIEFIVARDLVDSDAEVQTDPKTGLPSRWKDGRVKQVMKVPARVQPSQEFPDGKAVWYCGPAARDELARAMALVGAPAGPPEGGAWIAVTQTGTRPSGPGLNPAKTWAVEYARPQGAGQGQAPATPQTPEQAPAPVQQPEQPQGQQFQAPQQPQFGQLFQAPQGMPQQFGQQPPAPQVPQAGAPEGMSADQAALLARLTGQQQG